MARSHRRRLAQSHLPKQLLSGRNLAERHLTGRPTCGLGRRGVRMDSSGEVGFMLPLAALMTLILLLGSLSVQGIALQRQMSDSILLKSRAKEDALASSAQVVASALQLSGSCLLKKDYNASDNDKKWKDFKDWKNNEEDKRCNSSFLSSLTGSIAGGTYNVIDYQYSQSSSSADLTISWNLASEKETQKTFTISIDSSVDPPKLLGVTP